MILVGMLIILLIWVVLNFFITLWDSYWFNKYYKLQDEYDELSKIFVKHIEDELEDLP